MILLLVKFLFFVEVPVCWVCSLKMLKRLCQARVARAGQAGQRAVALRGWACSPGQRCAGNARPRRFQKGLQVSPSGQAAWWCAGKSLSPAVTGKRVTERWWEGGVLGLSFLSESSHACCGGRPRPWGTPSPSSSSQCSLIPRGASFSAPPSSVPWSPKELGPSLLLLAIVLLSLRQPSPLQPRGLFCLLRCCPCCCDRFFSLCPSHLLMC